jgi:hypothetical protein
MISTTRHLLTFGSERRRRKRERSLELITLEDRCLLSTSDLTTTATVSTITRGVAVVQPVRSAYATNADAVHVGFTATDPDDPGGMPTSHFKVTELRTGTTVSGVGSSASLSSTGLYRVQYWSTDADDSEPAAAHTILIAIDRTAPSVTVNTASPNVLWPPNGKFVTVTVTGTAFDSFSGVNPSSMRFSVSDEYGRVQPSGSITNLSESTATAFGGFEVINFSFQVTLQSRRFGYDFDGRQYIVHVTTRDIVGNSTMGSTVVTVPHDMGNHGGRLRGAGQGTQIPVGNSGHKGGHQNNSHGSSGNLKLGGTTTHGHDKKLGHGQKNGQGNPFPPAATNPGPVVGQVSNGGHGNGNHESGHGNGNGNVYGNGHGHGHGGN